VNAIELLEMLSAIYVNYYVCHRWVVRNVKGFDCVGSLGRQDNGTK
jgi:hypothetical protein